MKFIFVLMILGLSINTLKASESCNGQTTTHAIRLEQSGSNVVATLKNLKPFKYGDVSTPQDGKFKVTGIDISSATIYNIDLPTLMMKPRLGSEFIVKMLFGRAEFDGEADMIHAYAYDIFKAARCE